jgi:hypothetical protein
MNHRTLAEKRSEFDHLVEDLRKKQYSGGYPHHFPFEDQLNDPLVNWFVDSLLLRAEPQEVFEVWLEGEATLSVATVAHLESEYGIEAAEEGDKLEFYYAFAARQAGERIAFPWVESQLRGPQPPSTRSIPDEILRPRGTPLTATRVFRTGTGTGAVFLAEAAFTDDGLTPRETFVGGVSGMTGWIGMRYGGLYGAAATSYLGGELAGAYWDSGDASRRIVSLEGLQPVLELAVVNVDGGAPYVDPRVEEELSTGIGASRPQESPVPRPSDAEYYLDPFELGDIQRGFRTPRPEGELEEVSALFEEAGLMVPDAIGTATNPPRPEGEMEEVSAFFEEAGLMGVAPRPTTSRAARPPDLPVGDARQEFEDVSELFREAGLFDAGTTPRTTVAPRTFGDPLDEFQEVTELFREAGLDGTGAPAPIPAASPNPAISIVDYLDINGLDSSFAARQAYARNLGISAYSGTATQNLLMLQMIRDRADPTRLPRPTPPPPPTVPSPPASEIETSPQASLPSSQPPPSVIVQREAELEAFLDSAQGQKLSPSEIRYAEAQVTVMPPATVVAEREAELAQFLANATATFSPSEIAYMYAQIYN